MGADDEGPAGGAEEGDGEDARVGEGVETEGPRGGLEEMAEVDWALGADVGG